MIPRLALPSAIVAFALAGCATPPKPANAQAEIDRQILSAAQKIQAAQADLYQAGAINQVVNRPPEHINQAGAINQVVNRPPEHINQAGAINQVVNRPPEHIIDDRNRVTLWWQGDAIQLLDKLAHDRGLTFSYIGVRMPLPVNVNVENETYDTILRLVRTQIGYRAQITRDQDRLVLQFNRPQS
ncbi:Conjugal transfer protein TraH [Burkholderia diffusa]|uniref:DotD/TraH family lipoprotein n=1 Tax=Burkholderia diffusa TaxID=488732 RepID=UPI001CB10F30|nr:DotD/TraH family lipoprotein [Burkholderia diffusa]CAG9261013.1 Conjugal transfer protein TraH [Burkholderia diffusa]